MKCKRIFSSAQILFFSLTLILFFSNDIKTSQYDSVDIITILIALFKKQVKTCLLQLVHWAWHPVCISGNNAKNDRHTWDDGLCSSQFLLLNCVWNSRACGFCWQGKKRFRGPQWYWDTFVTGVMRNGWNGTSLVFEHSTVFCLAPVWTFNMFRIPENMILTNTLININQY